MPAAVLDHFPDGKDFATLMAVNLPLGKPFGEGGGYNRDFTEGTETPEKPQTPAAISCKPEDGKSRRPAHLGLGGALRRANLRDSGKLD
jgi:hypothetical protein